MNAMSARAAFLQPSALKVLHTYSFMALVASRAPILHYLLHNTTGGSKGFWSSGECEKQWARRLQPHLFLHHYTNREGDGHSAINVPRPGLHVGLLLLAPPSPRSSSSFLFSSSLSSQFFCQFFWYLFKKLEAVNNEPAKVPGVDAENESGEVPTDECNEKEVEKEEHEVSKVSAGQGDEPLLEKEQPTCNSNETHDTSTVDLDTPARPEGEAATVVDEVPANEGDNEPMDQDTVDQSNEVETAASVLEGELGGHNDEEPGSPLTTDNEDDAGEGEEEKEGDEEGLDEEESGDEEGMDEEDPGDIDIEVEIENEKPKQKAKAKAKKTVVVVEPSQKSSRIVEKAREASETQKQREPTSELAQAAPRHTAKAKSSRASSGETEPHAAVEAANPTAKAAPGNSRLLFSKDDIVKTFTGLDAVFDRPLWRIKESDIFLEPDVVLQMNLFAPEVCKPEPVPNAPPPPQGETPNCNTQSAPDAPPESPSNPQPLDTQPPSETPVPAGDQPPNEAPTPAPTPNQTQSDTPAPAPATCNVGVQATDTERCIQWKKRALEIPIPTTHHDMMFELVRIWDSMSGRHKQDSFELEAEDKLRVFTQKDWEQVNDEERLALFGNVNVVVKKEKNSSDKTPEHILPEITRWDRREIAKVFDLYAPRFMYEQLWVSDQVRKRVADPDAKDPIPCYKLIDNGTWSAINRWLNEDKLKGPMFPEIIEPGPWKLGEPQPHEDITLGQTNDNPQLIMRCGMLNQLLENRARHQKCRKELIEEAAKEIASAASEETPTAEAAKEKASVAPGEAPTAEAAPQEAGLAVTASTNTSSQKTAPIAGTSMTKDAIPSAALQKATLAFNYLLHAFPALVKFLDIPLSASVGYLLPIGGLEGFPNLQSQNNPVKPFATESPTLDMRWGLFASGGAVTNAHTDVAGLATYVYIKLGRKLWFIGIPTSYLPEATVINSEQELRLTDAVAQLRQKKRRMMEKNAKEGDAKEGDATEGDATEDGEKFERLNAFPLKRTIDGKEYMPYVSTHRGFEIGALRWVVVMLEPGDELGPSLWLAVYEYRYNEM
ncbi:hypothetical protein SCHPADRAFT_896486 [Schizopora paradoxa]|uniref:Uncharacterized protein n=1 Tax=Schizopora paradoxa TaxID=27342 RepID=A0A0H2RK41_9AGAM|nr:hypothetical protein SCHPADRAFT_896486 [Schizopora paradoxa]